MATCLVVEHGPFERPYRVGDALAAAGVAIETRRPYHGDPVPASASAWSGIVVMGGEMSARSDAGFPSRRAELELLTDAVARQVPVLGICLGAQMLAVAGGGQVFPGPAGLELGWTPVRLGASAATDPLFRGVAPCLSVLNWHRDSFELPAAAVPLATGEVYRNQAFRIGERAWGVQFHLEVDAAAVAQFIAAFSEEVALASGGPMGLAAAATVALAELAPVRDLILGRFATLVASGDR